MNLPRLTSKFSRKISIKTQEKSTFSLSGEVAMNMPNRNATDKQAVPQPMFARSEAEARAFFGDDFQRIEVI